TILCRTRIAHDTASPPFAPPLLFPGGAGLNLVISGPLAGTGFDRNSSLLLPCCRSGYRHIQQRNHALSVRITPCFERSSVCERIGTRQCGAFHFCVGSDQVTE